MLTMFKDGERKQKNIYIVFCNHLSASFIFIKVWPSIVPNTRSRRITWPSNRMQKRAHARPLRGRGPPGFSRSDVCGIVQVPCTSLFRCYEICYQLEIRWKYENKKKKIAGWFVPTFFIGYYKIFSGFASLIRTIFSSVGTAKFRDGFFVNFTLLVFNLHIWW